MSSYIIQDDVLAPRHELIIEYTGPNPFGIYPQIDPLMRLIFEAKGTHMFEPKFQWDTTEDPRPFFIQTYVQKAFDRFTKFKVAITLQGKQPTDKTKSGKMTLVISGRLFTEFNTDNPVTKIFFTPFFYLYSIAYYNKIRRQYIQWVRDNIYKLENQIRDRLNIPQSETKFSEELAQEAV